ncbi:MAG: sigma-70 family RNA polymerase sigma factor [Acidimicrobiales bacterium]
MASTVAPEPARANDEDALVRANLSLVTYAVAELACRIPRHVSRDDLVSAGMAGLAQAARSYDPERGVAFPRFAAARIRGALIDELRSRDWASRSVRARARTMAATADRLTGELGRTPSAAEIAEAMGVEVRTISSLAGDVHRAVVLNFEALPLEGHAEEVLLVDDATPDDDVLALERRAYLVAAVAHLPERLRRVVIGYFFEDMPMQALAEELGVTDSRISQMRAEALGLLKDGINSQLDPDLVDNSHLTPRGARKQETYHTAIAEHATPKERLDAKGGKLSVLVA